MNRTLQVGNQWLANELGAQQRHKSRMRKLLTALFLAAVYSVPFYFLTACCPTPDDAQQVDAAAEIHAVRTAYTQVFCKPAPEITATVYTVANAAEQCDEAHGCYCSAPCDQVFVSKREVFLPSRVCPTGTDNPGCYVSQREALVHELTHSVLEYAGESHMSHGVLFNRIKDAAERILNK